MKVLIACETSGTCRKAFENVGHEAYSCDLLPADDGSVRHTVADAIDTIRSAHWDLVIAHPPCTFLTAAGLHWNRRRPERQEQTDDAARFFMSMVEACDRHADRWAIENPIGCMSRLYRKPNQIIQPYDYGANASKATCLWLCGLPNLRPTRRVAGRVTADGKERWENQTDSGQNRLPPSKNRWQLRSKTYPGIAEAMAQQWGL